MILDLHTHSIKSDDGRAKVENYCKWIRKKELDLDGFVLTEHRQFDAESDYTALGDQYDLVILKASEVETDYGHVLLFGVNEALVREFDFARVDNPLPMVLEAAERHGAFAAPCHPGRKNVGLFAHYETKGSVPEVHTVEILNGGSIPGEDERSVEQARRHGYRGFGGSDSHIVSRIGYRATRFAADLGTIDELVQALRSGEFEAVSLVGDEYQMISEEEEGVPT
jgi:predicted metal-dependent phosphoesterase TrpH